MSIKTTKRMALGVIATLVFAPLVAVAPASAGNGSATATVGPVRVSATNGVQDVVPKSSLSFVVPAGTAIVEAGITAVTFAVTTAPSASAEVTLWGAGDATKGVKDSVAAASATVNGFTAATDLIAGNASTAAAASTVTLGVSVASVVSGKYAGTLTIVDADDTVTVDWSFTTTGAPASISLSPTSVSIPATADAADPNGAFTTSKTVTVSLLDAAGNVTQSGTGDSVVATIPSNTNIGFTDSDDAATLTISDSDLTDGKHDIVVGSKTTTADTETITFTPAGVLPALGVAAATLTATTVGYGVETNVKTALTTPSSTNVVKAGTVSAGGAEAAYTVDTSVTTLVFTVSGYTPGAAYLISIDSPVGNPAFTAKDDTSNTTATASNANAKALYGIAGATGSVVVTIVIAATTAADVIGVSGNNANATSVDSADARVTYTAAAYAVAVTAPAVTPTLAVTSAPIAMAGTVKDTYSNPVSGAVVTVTGTVTPAGTAITGTATTAADGSWSLTMPATTATTTSVSLVAAAVKTGLTITDAAAVEVNFNASGSPDTLTWSDGIAGANEDSAAGTALDPVTAYPATVVPYTGTVGGATGITDETYTIATAAFSTADTAVENCVALTPTTSPAAQVVFTGSAGVKFTTTACTTAQTVATLKDTVTVASGTAAYAIATKTGANTVTMTSGTVTKSATFHAFNYFDSAAATNGDSVRNIAVDKTSVSLKAGEFAVLTISATDAFGNAVTSITAGNGGTVTATASGAAFVEGPSLSKAVSAAWDANGQIMIGVIGSQTPGTGTITIKGTGEQLGAAAGAATGTTAGTNGLTASVATLTVSVTVVGAPEPEPVYEKPTLSFVKDGNRIILSGTAVDGEGDIIIYVKSVGSTTWVEKAKTLEVASPGDFNGSIRAFKKNKVIRVKQEGTGLFSNQIIVTK